MKPTKILLITIVAAIPYAASVANIPMSLKAACDKKIIKVTIHGTSGHYGECMQLDITNLTYNPLDLKLETGRKLICTSDTTHQNMMVTRELIFALKGKEKRTYKINAMCIQKSHDSPGDDTYYKIGNMAEGYLLQLAQLIDKYNYQDNAAQKSVWTVIAKADSNNLGLSTNSLEEKNALLRFVALAKAGKTIQDNMLFYKPNSTLYKESVEYNISGNINWYMIKKEKVSLAVYDEAGNYITDIFINKEYEAGNRHCDFRVVSCLLKPDVKYVVKVKIGDEIIEQLACTGK